MRIADFYNQISRYIQLGIAKLFGRHPRTEFQGLIPTRNRKPLKIINIDSEIEIQDIEIIPTPAVVAEETALIDKMKVNDAIKYAKTYTAEIENYFGSDTLHALQEVKSVSLLDAELKKINKAVSVNTNNMYFQKNTTTVIFQRSGYAFVGAGIVLIAVGTEIFSQNVIDAHNVSNELWLETYKTCVAPYQCNSPFHFIKPRTDCIYGIPHTQEQCGIFYTLEDGFLNHFECVYLNLTYSCSLMLCEAQRAACTKQDLAENPFYLMIAFGMASLIVGILMAAIAPWGKNKSRSACRVDILNEGYNKLNLTSELVDSISSDNTLSTTKNVIQLLTNRKNELRSTYESKISYVPAVRKCEFFPLSKENKILNEPSVLFKNAAQIVEIDDEEKKISSYQTANFY